MKKKSLITILVTAFALTASPAAFATNPGDTGQAGGIVIKVNPDGSYLEVAPVDSAPSEWSSTTNWVTGANSAVDGEANTDAIVADCTAPCTSLAEQASSYSLGGYTDWYMPSSDEVQTMVGAKGTNASLPQTGVIWSSTEAAATKANAMVVNINLLTALNKGTIAPTRWVRVSTNPAQAPAAVPAPIAAPAPASSGGTWSRQIGAVEVKTRLLPEEGDQVTWESSFYCPEGWYNSWAQWPKDGNGGYICGYDVPRYGQ